jgi:hypothetical protein
MARKFGFLVLVLIAGIPALASTGTISGYVKDTSGTPQIGAVVEVFTSAAALGTVVFTDNRGFFAADNLLPGTYQIKVSAVSFLPSLKENVSLRSGAQVLVNVTLTTLADARRIFPPRRTGASDPDDWHWTLNSAANRPVLRVLERERDKNKTAADPAEASIVSVLPAESSQDRALKGRLAFMAGAEADGFGSTGDMTTSFALEKSLFASGLLSLDGNVGGSYSGDPAGVVRASYSHDFGASSKPTLTLTYRRFATPSTPMGNSPYDAIEMNSSDRMTVAEVVDLQYGAAIQSLEFAKRVTAFRPYGALTVHLSPNTLVEYRYATAEPDTRAAKGFDSAPADFSESGPKMALAGGVPDVERAQHQEVSVSRRMGKTSIQAACYLDHVRNLILTGAGDPTSYSDDVLADIYSDTFSYAYPGGLRTSGVRVVVERKILDDLTATLDYSTGGAITADAPGSWQALNQSLATTRQHSLGGKVSGYLPASGTRWIASYKWSTGNAIYPVDAFNASPGQMDAFLSLFIRQRLPGVAFIPGRVDALIDLRNLLAQGYMPVLGPDGRTVYLLQSARSLRAGLAFSF